jgi:PII-like signaling protein
VSPGVRRSTLDGTSIASGARTFSGPANVYAMSRSVGVAPTRAHRIHTFSPHFADGGFAMQGYQLTFFTQQDRRHGHRSLGDWLVLEARRLGIGGATLIGAVEGFGHHRKLHAAHFFELADQPLEVTMAVSAEEAERMFARLREEGIDLFYVMTPAEFGMTGER